MYIGDVSQKLKDKKFHVRIASTQHKDHHYALRNVIKIWGDFGVTFLKKPWAYFFKNWPFFKNDHNFKN